MLKISFERGEKTRFDSGYPPIACLDSLPMHSIVTGHVDGSIRIWDFQQKQLQKIEAHKKPLKALRLIPGAGFIL